jgi:hypothetical protein
MGSPARPRVRFGEGDVLQFRIELEGLLPVVWRRIIVSARASLHELHGVIERAMGRDAGGGYLFEVDGVRYADAEGDPGPGREGEYTALEALQLAPGARFSHVAEGHSEPWRHLVTLEQIAPRMVGQRLPVCVGGGRAAPPIECDGARGYRALLAAMREPLDPRAADLRTWLPDDFDPEFVNLVAINADLAKVPKHRPAA